MGGVDEALDDDVIDDGAAGVWCSGSGDELLMAVAVAALVVDDIVDDEDEDDGKICSALLPFSDAGPVWSSIMRLTVSAKKKEKSWEKRSVKVLRSKGWKLIFIQAALQAIILASGWKHMQMRSVLMPEIISEAFLPLENTNREFNSEQHFQLRPTLGVGGPLERKWQQHPKKLRSSAFEASSKHGERCDKF